MAILREITVKLANSPGTLSRVSRLLGAERINMLAMSIDPSGQLRMVVDNPLHAVSTLREQHYNVDERDVLYTAMSNEPGSLARTLRLLGEAGINIEYAYASGIDRVPMVGVVIAVADAQKASYVAGIQMRLFIPTMDAVLVEFDQDGRIRFDNEDWSTPSLQERRAIIHAAKDQVEHLKELLDALESEP